MAFNDPSKTNTYELPATGSDSLSKNGLSKKPHTSLPVSLLVNNILWFCRIRWVMIAILVILGALGFFPEMFYPIGLKPRADWPLILAGILAAVNSIYLWYVHKRPVKAKDANLNLWSQIIVDILAVTVVVHFTGCLETYVAFIYLFHIVLACIFFSRPQSFVVVVMASVLYSGCVIGGLAFGSSPGIYLNTALRKQIEGVAFFNVASAVAIWLVVWALASRISVMMREQSNELAQKNRLLLKAQDEKTKDLLRTTHELKAPFAAIQINTQLLLKGECGALPDKALEIVRRIGERSRWLSFEIKEMLQLANLRSAARLSLCWVKIDLASALKWSINHVQATAKERDITFEEELNPSFAKVVDEHIKMLFTNLLHNAIIYSHKGSKIKVSCGPDSQGRQVVTVEDNGIGIPRDKLPRIFDEYYRTNEALHHNKISTGLGLAIVRHVADTHDIRIKVESEAGVGTRFSLFFSPVYYIKVS
jgi:signal transduction histidine kinase